MMKDGSADLRRIRDPEKAAAMSEIRGNGRNGCVGERYRTSGSLKRL
jgi:hypothetical protein